MSTQIPAASNKTSPTAILAFVALVGFGLAIAGIFLFGRIKNGYEAAQLLAGHETAQGVITETGFTKRPASYQVMINGESYTGKAGQELQGTPITIAYRADNPAVNRPADGLWLDLIFGGVLLAAIPILILIVFIKTKTRQGVAERAQWDRENEPAV